MTADISRALASIASTYSTDTIFILGKGPSIDAIDVQAFAGCLTIGLNDAEQITPTDITIFHADWVKQGIAASGYRASLYVTSTAFSAPGRTVVNLPYAPLTQESADLMLQRLQGDELVVEDVLMMTALQLARRVAAIRGRRQTVYMVGFDFTYDAEHVYSQGIARDFVPGPESDKRVRIQMQEYFFINALYLLKGSDLDIRHVGGKPFSALTAVELCQAFAPAPPDSAAYRTTIVAEITTNHFGDRARLERMIRAVKRAGGDMVKLQKRDVDSFYSPDQLRAPYLSPFGRTLGDYRRHLELSRDDFAFVDELCRSLGLGWFASILDEPSFRFIRQFAPSLVKLPSTISEHTDYLASVAGSYDGAIVLSTGMTDQAYEDWVLATFTRCSRLYLMQANSAYPTPLADCGIGVVARYAALARDNPRIVPAYSSHDVDWFGSTLALAAGARMIEKHVKLGNTEWAHFDAVALDLGTPAFAAYVQKLREAETALGTGEKAVRPSEHHKYRRVR